MLNMLDGKCPVVQHCTTCAKRYTAEQLTAVQAGFPVSDYHPAPSIDRMLAYRQASWQLFQVMARRASSLEIQQTQLHTVKQQCMDSRPKHGIKVQFQHLKSSAPFERPPVHFLMVVGPGCPKNGLHN